MLEKTKVSKISPSSKKSREQTRVMILANKAKEFLLLYNKGLGISNTQMEKLTNYYQT